MVMGILLAIAIPNWFALTETRRVSSSTNQVVADFRLANSKATNRLSSWAIVLAPGRAGEDAGPDYYTVKLTSSDTVDTSATPSPQYLPERVRVMNDLTSLNDAAAVTSTYTSAAGFTTPPATSRTLRFRSSGQVETLATGTGSDTVKVTEDGSPLGKVTFFVATGKVGGQIVN